MDRSNRISRLSGYSQLQQAVHCKYHVGRRMRSGRLLEVPLSSSSSFIINMQLLILRTSNIIVVLGMSRLVVKRQVAAEAAANVAANINFSHTSASFSVASISFLIGWYSFSLH